MELAVREAPRTLAARSEHRKAAEKEVALRVSGLHRRLFPEPVLPPARPTFNQRHMKKSIQTSPVPFVMKADKSRPL